MDFVGLLLLCLLIAFGVCTDSTVLGIVILILVG